MGRAELGAWGFMAIAGSGLGRDTTLPRARGALRAGAATRLDCQARTHRRGAGAVQPWGRPHRTGLAEGPRWRRVAAPSTKGDSRGASDRARRGSAPPSLPRSPPAVLSSGAWTTSSDLGGRACCTLSALGGATLHWPSRGRSLSGGVLGGGRGPRPRRGARVPPAREGWTSPVRADGAGAGGLRGSRALVRERSRPSRSTPPSRRRTGSSSSPSRRATSRPTTVGRATPASTPRGTSRTTAR